MYMYLCGIDQEILCECHAQNPILPSKHTAVPLLLFHSLTASGLVEATVMTKECKLHVHVCVVLHPYISVLKPIQGGINLHVYYHVNKRMISVRTSNIGEYTCTCKYHM